MAEAMQGIMALQGASGMGGQAAPELNVTPEQMAAFESARGQINPAEFGTELLKAGEQIDPMELKSLRDMLKQANLSPQIIDAIGQMVDTVLAEPEKYQEIRSRFLAEGVPEELLPEQFDAEFFAALNLALDQVNTSFPQDNPMQGGIASMPMGAAMPMATPETFARGGLASLKPIAAGLAQMGRRGDTMLAHITPAEARMLRRRGGSGTTNPATGLPEFFLGGVFKAVGNAFKSVGKAVVSGVKAVAKGVKKFASSTVGRIVIAAALFYFAGPAAASILGPGASAVAVGAVKGFVAGFGSTLLAGKGVKEALKIGAIGSVAAGVGAGVMGGSQAFAAGSYTGPTTFSGAVDNLVSGAKGLVGATPQMPGAEALPVAAPSPLSGTTDFSPVQMPSPAASPVNVSSLSPSTPAPVDLANLDYQPSSFPGQGNVASVGREMGMYTPREVSYGSSAAPVTSPAATTAATPDAVDVYGIRSTPKNAFSFGTPSTPTPTPPPGGTERGFFGNLLEKISPSTPSEAQLNDIGRKAFINEKALSGSDFLADRAAKFAVAKATPSILRQYGPLALGALGLTAASGGFKQQPVEQPNISGGRTGQQLLEEDPASYRPFFGGVRRVASTPTAYYTPSTYTNQVNPVEPVRNFAQGGITSLDGYPKKQGAINGAGTGTSDSIKALLSDGEFVFTAKAVRGAGQGSRRKGAKRMYQLMRSLEGKA